MRSGLCENLLQIGAGGVDLDPHLRRRFGDRHAADQVADEAALDTGEPMQLAQRIQSSHHAKRRLKDIDDRRRLGSVLADRRSRAGWRNNDDGGLPITFATKQHDVRAGTLARLVTRALDHVVDRRFEATRVLAVGGSHETAPEAQAELRIEMLRGRLIGEYDRAIGAYGDHPALAVIQRFHRRDSLRFHLPHTRIEVNLRSEQREQIGEEPCRTGATNGRRIVEAERQKQRLGLLIGNLDQEVTPSAVRSIAHPLRLRFLRERLAGRLCRG